MLSKRVMALLLIVLGSILLFAVYQSSQGLGEQVTEAATGPFADATEWFIVLGVASSVAGVGFLLLCESSVD